MNGSNERSDAGRLFDHVFAGGAGLACVMTGGRVGGRLAEVRNTFFPYPDGLAEMVEHALDEDGRGREAYFCAHLLTERSRRKEFAAPIWTLWADGDGARPLLGLRPTAVVESSPGRHHYYFRLGAAVEPAEAETLNRELALAMGADRSGHDLTQLLRVPGTHNRKYSAMPIVRLIHVE